MVKIIFLGPPGAGKGTYSSRLETKLKIPHISTGDMFRQAITQGTDLGRKVSDYIRQGELVPDETTIAVLKNRIDQQDCAKGFILDGYPRTIPQAKALDRVTAIDIVFNLVIPKSILFKKLSARRVCKLCGEIYNLTDIAEYIDGIKYDMPPMLPRKPGICDKCGGVLEQRKDDTLAVIEQRFNVYEAQTEPLIKYYKQQGRLREIYVNSGPESMVPKIMAELKKI